MKQKHINRWILTCQAQAQTTSCRRHKHGFGAVIINPERNTVISTGYNGPPRGGGELCGGNWCLRDGLDPEQLEIGGSTPNYHIWYRKGGISSVLPEHENRFTSLEEAQHFKEKLIAKHPPIESGKENDVGCFHAEENAIYNAAAEGHATAGGWCFVNSEPCLKCAKALHHAGIKRVLITTGRYVINNGLKYLKDHGVVVVAVELSLREERDV
jgi:dCMP deaminase